MVELATVNKEKETAEDRELPLSFIEKRHTQEVEGIPLPILPWRFKDRMKTVSVALVLCLNVGVDPPDVVKTQPCARLECWIDPSTLSPAKALDAIAGSLQKQYERWQPRARYKQALDPTSDDVKKLCTSLRRNAKEERVLFHYNGHGVPKPTTNGEIWVFNRTYTQYIPLSIYDLQSWMGSPSIYVYDCSHAGLIIESFQSFALQHQNEHKQTQTQASAQGRMTPIQEPPNYQNCIHLAACSTTQMLPMNPDLPADLFTACLTTPIKVAVRWFITRHTARLVPELTLELVEKIPGLLTDRKTMLGELNWILTAITDTIAWNTLPRDLFQKLFRQDLLVASLFRNFLLAERILRSYDCTPISFPILPQTHQHPMWKAWDYALDLSLKQLPDILNKEKPKPYQQLTFFEDQLTAFEVWLKLGSQDREPPMQLPIVLQVLLSNIHRLRALELLAKFLDLGTWAIHLGLSVGIFPYVLKLLQSVAQELRPLLVFIWAKILALDNDCQKDLVRDKAHTYFINVLRDSTIDIKSRTLAAFSLSCIVNNYREGQEVALQGSLVSDCLFLLDHPNSQLKKWVTICLARLWDHYDEARWTGVRDTGHVKLYTLLLDPCPEVRAAAVYALGTFINSVSNRSEQANNIDHSIAITLYNTVHSDISSLVRRELVAALQWIVLAFEHAFVNVAMHENTITFSQDGSATPTLKRVGSRSFMSPVSSSHDSSDLNERLKRVASSSSISTLSHTLLSHHGSLGTLSNVSFASVYSKIWIGLCNLEKDPHPEVAELCSFITSHIRSKVKETVALTKEQVDRMSASMSLPPSPNRSSNFLSGDSPPSLNLNTDLHRYAAKTSLASRNRKIYQNTINEEGKGFLVRNPLVTTKFVPWSCKYFAEQLIKSTEVDVESANFYEKEWRLERNAMVRRDAQEEHKRAASSKLDSQIFSTRSAAPPSVLQFHPYDQQIAVASLDSFGIWDWGRGAKICNSQNKSVRYQNTSKITALEWVNSHDIALLMVASDDGSVKLWHPNKNSNRESVMVSAWQAYNDMTPIKVSNSSGLLLSWEQWSQTVITAGDSRYIRFWDVAQELRAFEIPSGTDAAITCIDSSFSNLQYAQADCYMEDFDSTDTGINMCMDDEISMAGRQKQGLVVAGCTDGSVRLFDRRCPPLDMRVKTWMEHGSWVFGVQLRDNKIISGCIGGDVRTYDIRKNDSIFVNYVAQPNDMSAFAVHPTSDIYACGLVNHNISVHNIAGRNLNVIRFYEGFMSHKMGPVSSLAFHPHKIALAAGNVDCTVTVYAMDHRR